MLHHQTIFWKWFYLQNYVILDIFTFQSERVDFKKDTKRLLYFLSLHNKFAWTWILTGFSKCYLKCPKIAIYFFSLFHAHTKRKLWSFTIRKGTILLALNTFCITWHTREKIFKHLENYWWCNQKWLDKKKRVHNLYNINYFHHFRTLIFTQKKNLRTVLAWLFWCFTSQATLFQPCWDEFLSSLCGVFPVPR